MMRTSVEESCTATASNSDCPRVLLSHPTGNQNVRNALRGFFEHDMLAEFWTTVSWNPNSWWSGFLPEQVRGQLARRVFSEAPRGVVKTTPWRELVRQGAHATPLRSILCSGERPFSTIGMYRNFDRRVAKRVPALKPDVVYAYEGGALHTFRQAKRCGATTIHEQPSSYWGWVSKLLVEEAEANPEFSNLLPTLRDPAGHLAWKEEELQLADYVMVPSDHVRNTLGNVVAPEKIRVIPYGAPPVLPRARMNTDPRRPLQVLFVGNLGQHKGIGYLLQAIEQLGDRVQLTLVGRRLQSNPKVDEACRRWRWFESLPHASVLEVMQQCDVLVLPSLCEGCALVVLEALACGLPVIVTPNTGSLAFVRDGREGFVVPIRRAEAIAEHLETLSADRQMLAEMSRRAQAAAAENSWENYRINLARVVRSLA